jgi:hypothetical protein
LFSNSSLSFFGHISWVQASCLTIRRTIWSEWTQAWWSPSSKLSFECPWPPLSRFSLTPDCSDNHLIWLDLIRTVPLSLQ